MNVGQNGAVCLNIGIENLKDRSTYLLLVFHVHHTLYHTIYT